MPKAQVSTYSLIELPAINSSTSDNNNHLQIPTMTDETNGKNAMGNSLEQLSSSPNRVRFLEPKSPGHIPPIPSKSPRSVPSFESFEGQTLDIINDLHQDGPNSVSRGLQTDISSASVIDWVIAQKSSSTGDRYLKIEFIN